MQFIIKKYLGKELSEKESAKLFENNVETFINTLNDMIKTINSQKISQENIENSNDSLRSDSKDK